MQLSEDKYTKFSCPNPNCKFFNLPGQDTITHRSWTGKNKDIERLRCTECGHEFSERQGTLMANSKLPEETVERLLKCQRWGVCDEGTADICDVDIKTVYRFQNVSSKRAKDHHFQAVKDLEVEGVQMDEAHSKLRKKKVQWIHSALAMKSYFILWVAFGNRTTEKAVELIAQVVARVKGIPVFLTDGWKVYKTALLQVLGKVYSPRRRGKVGRKPKARLTAPKDLYYGHKL